MSPVSDKPMLDISNGYYQWFSDVFWGNDDFSIFSHFDPWKPLWRGDLTEWGSWGHYYGSQAIPWTQPQSRKKGQFNQKYWSCPGDVIDFVESVKFSFRVYKGRGGGGSTFIKSEWPETCCVKCIWYLGTYPAEHKLSATNNHWTPVLIYNEYHGQNHF